MNFLRIVITLKDVVKQIFVYLEIELVILLWNVIQWFRGIRIRVQSHTSSRVTSDLIIKIMSEHIRIYDTSDTEDIIVSDNENNNKDDI